jgi:protein TonB
VGFEFATNDQLRAAIHGDDRAARLDEFLNRTAFRSTPGAPQVAASRLRPAIDAFVQSAVTSVLASRYGPPAQGPLAFDVTVHFAGPRVTQGVDPDSPLAVGALRVGGNISPPKKIQDVRPAYPPEAQAAGVQGVVIMEARIEGDGSVSQARVLRSIPGLDEAALDAVRHWRFTPTLLNGVPTPVVMVVTIQFTLQ